MLKPSVRILVLQEFDQFRKAVAPILHERTNWHVVGVAVDARDAVRLAAQLQPDLILLDIDLPRMNGVKAARRIRGAAPDSKIIFMGQESSIGIVHEAFRLGASSYVIKEHAQRELIPALEAVLQKRQFIGSGVQGPTLVDKKQPVTDHRVRQILVPLLSSSSQGTLVGTNHEVQFYSDDVILFYRVVSFITAALRAGHSAVVCAGKSFRADLHRVLQVREPDIADFIRSGRYVTLDAADTLSELMVGSIPDTNKFLGLLGGVITAAAEAARTRLSRVALYQECATLLWAQGREEATIQVEQLFNKLAYEYDLDILCGYSITYFDVEEDSHLIQRICAEHSAVHSE
jgi:DNA-binding NarL/FixJ family response regulator